MTEPTEQDTLYREHGARWVAVFFGPLFALLGYLTELLSRGPVHGVEWLLVGLGLAAITAPWVQARRRLLGVKLTGSTLWQGREALPVSKIADVTEEVGAPAGAHVLGGGWTVPRKYQELPIKLRDGTVVLGWAKDAEALRVALRGLLETPAT